MLVEREEEGEGDDAGEEGTGGVGEGGADGSIVLPSPSADTCFNVTLISSTLHFANRTDCAPTVPANAG